MMSRTLVIEKKDHPLDRKKLQFLSMLSNSQSHLEESRCGEDAGAPSSFIIIFF